MSNLPPRFLYSCFLRSFRVATSLAAVALVQIGVAQSAPAAAKPASDELVLSNGDTLHGQFVSETAGSVIFHSDPLGNITLGWDKVKEIHVAGKFGVLGQTVAARGRKQAVHFPVGSFDVADKTVTVHTAATPEPAPIPVAKAQYIMDSAELDKQLNHAPGFFVGWNGAATAGATIVSATENQFTFTSAVNLVRTVPTVNWLAARNRMLFNFNEAYGKITQPAYAYPAVPPATGSVFVPALVTKSSIMHIGAERDEYFSPRFYALGLTTFDHNFAQDLQLQQIYGGGLGWTAMKTPRQELDVKATAQYEKQHFIPGTGNVDENLIGSTFGANYTLHLKLLTYTQALSYIPAYNQLNAYSATETNSVAFPAYKNFSFSVGTLDSYLNNAPYLGSAVTPPTKPNSFQFTMGVTYNIKSKY